MLEDRSPQPCLPVLVFIRLRRTIHVRHRGKRRGIVLSVPCPVSPSLQGRMEGYLPETSLRQKEKPAEEEFLHAGFLGPDMVRAAKCQSTRKKAGLP
jgi:hypothetical protein